MLFDKLACDFCLAGVRTGIGDVFPNAGREEYRILEHDGELVPQVGQLVLAQIDAVEQDLPVGGVIEPR